MLIKGRGLGRSVIVDEPITRENIKEAVEFLYRDHPSLPTTDRKMGIVVSPKESYRLRAALSEELGKANEKYEEYKKNVALTVFMYDRPPYADIYVPDMGMFYEIPN